MKKTMAGLCVAATLASGVAQAAGEGWYILGAAGQTTSNNDKATLDAALTSVGAVGYASTLNKPTVYKLQAGYQINRNFAVEGGYIGSGKETYTASGGNLAGPVVASGKVNGWNLNAVGILPVANQFGVLGKLGVAGLRFAANVTGPGGVASASVSKTDITYGIGAKYDFTDNIYVRLDLDSYKIGARNTIWMLGLGYKL